MTASPFHSLSPSDQARILAEVRTDRRPAWITTIQALQKAIEKDTK